MDCIRRLEEVNSFLAKVALACSEVEIFEEACPAGKEKIHIVSHCSLFQCLAVSSD